jgi:hypothetical protein
VIGDWKYEDYLCFSPEKGWLTPFDPLHETRLPDLAEYKRKLASKEIEFPTYSDRAKFKEYYCEPREFFGVEQLATFYKPVTV